MRSATWKNFGEESVKILKRGGVGVIPTDTLYGIVASALHKKAVARVYRLRHRAPPKPSIVMISKLADLAKFGIKPRPAHLKILKKYWPGKITFILPSDAKKLRHLHRGSGGMAFRVPVGANVRAFLRKTGPLIAPSANLEGEKPAGTIAQAKKYFGSSVDFYIDAGRRAGAPSTLVDLKRGKTKILRPGAVKFKG